jgi:trigger factor
MKTELIDVSPTRKQLVFEVPTEVVETEIERVTRTYGRSSRLPGFRPGKAPARLVRQHYKDQILHDVMHDLIPRVIDDAMRERALEPVDTPAVRDVTLEEGVPLRFTADFETVPPIDPIDYAGITLRRSPITVADEAVASMLERLRERHARHEPVEDRASRTGDVLTADLSRRVVKAASTAEAAEAGTPGAPERHTDVTIEIGGAANPPGFDAEITGLEAGAQKTFVVAFPAEYAVASLAGSEVEYEVHVKGIKAKTLPALDDEFAKDLGDFDSLEALRERVRHDLQHDAERTQEREVRNDLLRQLAARVTFDAPDALVDREVDRRTEEFVRQVMEQGVDPLKAGIDWEQFRERQRESSRETVKSLLVLDDIARRESIQVGEDEVDAEVARLAERTGRTAAAVRARLEKEGGLARLRAMMRRDKAMDHVMSRATIVAV